MRQDLDQPRDEQRVDDARRTSEGRRAVARIDSAHERDGIVERDVRVVDREDRAPLHGLVDPHERRDDREKPGVDDGPLALRHGRGEPRSTHCAARYVDAGEHAPVLLLVHE
jgi:hypothetical protein